MKELKLRVRLEKTVIVYEELIVNAPTADDPDDYFDLEDESLILLKKKLNATAVTSGDSVLYVGDLNSDDCVRYQLDGIDIVEEEDED